MFLFDAVLLALKSSIFTGEFSGVTFMIFHRFFKEIVSFHIHLRMDNGNNFYRLADGWIDETQMFIQIYFFVFLVCIL